MQEVCLELIKHQSSAPTKITAKGLPSYIVQLPLCSMSRDLKIQADYMPLGKLQYAVCTIAKDLENEQLSTALEKHPEFFSKKITEMIAAGEIYNTTKAVLKQLPAFIETLQKLQNSLRTPLVYLVSVFIVAGIILIAIAMFVIPKFKIIFADMGVALPVVTQLLISISDYLIVTWWIIPLLFLEPISYIRLLMGNKTVKIKLFGNLIKKIEMSRFIHALSLLVNAKIPLSSAFVVAKEVIDDPMIYKSMPDMYPKQNSEFLRSWKFNEEEIDIAQQNGKLNEALITLTEKYNLEVTKLIKKKIAVMEIMMIVLLGMIIGFVVIGLFLPLISLVQHMG